MKEGWGGDIGDGGSGGMSTETIIDGGSAFIDSWGGIKFEGTRD